jgi:hypothetical protein
MILFFTAKNLSLTQRKERQDEDGGVGRKRFLKFQAFLSSLLATILEAGGDGYGTEEAASDRQDRFQ